eukprot:gene14502-16648_t
MNETTGLPTLEGDGFILTSVDGLLHAAKSDSLWYLSFGLACCAVLYKEGILASEGSKECIQLMVDQGCELSVALCAALARGGNVDGLKL